MKPHIKVIQRNGVDIFVTSSMAMKATRSEIMQKDGLRGMRGGTGVGMGMSGAQSPHNLRGISTCHHDPAQTSGKY